MEKTIRIGDKDVTLSNTFDWAMNYREQFGHDIVPTLMPLLASVSEMAANMIAEVGDVKKMNKKVFARAIVDGGLDQVFIRLSGLEFVDLLNLSWAMAKTADEDTPEPRLWARQFDNSALDVLAPAVGELILKGMTSEKNSVRLLKMLEDLKPGTTTSK